MAIRGLGELERAVMERVWARPDPVTCRQVVDELAQDRPLAYNTVLTVMDRLAHKGLLGKRRAGRASIYWALQSSEAYTAALMRTLLTAAQDPSAVLLHLASQIDPDEARQLRAALAVRPHHVEAERSQPG